MISCAFTPICLWSVSNYFFLHWASISSSNYFFLHWAGISSSPTSSPLSAFREEETNKQNPPYPTNSSFSLLNFQNLHNFSPSLFFFFIFFVFHCLDHGKSEPLFRPHNRQLLLSLKIWIWIVFLFCFVFYCDLGGFLNESEMHSRVCNHSYW